MRRKSKVDQNQASIVSALRSAGATVHPLHSVGGGCPDLLVGHRGLNFLLEVKDGSLPQSARKLTPDQIKWHGQWGGQVCVVTSEMEALQVIGAVKARTAMHRLTED